MKTLLFTDTLYDPNGVSRFIQDMATIAEKRDDSFIVIGSTKKSFIHKNSSKIKNFNPKFSFPIPFYRELDITMPPFKKIEEFFIEYNPDIVNIATPGVMGRYGLKLAKKYNKIIVGTYHTDFSEYVYKNFKIKFTKKIALLYLKSFYKHFDYIFTRSNKYISHLINEIKIDENKIIPLPFAIDREVFNKNEKIENFWERYGLDSNRIKLLYVGRLTKEKNLDFIIKLYKNLQIDADFIFVGSGSLKEKVEKLHNSKMLGIKKGKELSQIYANSTLFIFPSTTETLGQVIMESMACGTPAIVSSTGGHLDFCTNKNSIILPLKIDLWKENIKRLIEDKKLYSNIKTEALNTVKQNSLESLYLKFITLQL